MKKFVGGTPWFGPPGSHYQKGGSHTCLYWGRECEGVMPYSNLCLPLPGEGFPNGKEHTFFVTVNV